GVAHLTCKLHAGCPESRKLALICYRRKSVWARQASTCISRVRVQLPIGPCCPLPSRGADEGAHEKFSDQHLVGPVPLPNLRVTSFTLQCADQDIVGLGPKSF